jgi:hypothetical protein
MRDDWPTQSWVHPFRPAGLLVLLAHAIDHGGHRRVAKWLASFATRKNELALEPSEGFHFLNQIERMAGKRNTVFPVAFHAFGRRESFLLFGEDPATIEQEYRDAKKRYRAALRAEKDWEKRAGVDGLAQSIE